MPTHLPGGRRRSIRLPGYDYTSPGAYFVTLCVRDRRRLLARVRGGAVQLTDLGALVRDDLLNVPSIRPEIDIDEYIVMPDHLHVIIAMGPRCERRPGLPRPSASLQSGSLGELIGQFKAGVTRRARELLGWGSREIWQRNYYEVIIRGPRHLEQVRQYIRANPARWVQRA